MKALETENPKSGASLVWPLARAFISESQCDQWHVAEIHTKGDIAWQDGKPLIWKTNIVNFATTNCKGIYQNPLRTTLISSKGSSPGTQITFL